MTRTLFRWPAQQRLRSDPSVQALLHRPWADTAARQTQSHLSAQLEPRVGAWPPAPPGATQHQSVTGVAITALAAATPSHHHGNLTQREGDEASSP